MGVAGSREVVVDVHPVAGLSRQRRLGGREYVRRAKDEDKYEKDYVCASGAGTFGHSTRQCLNVSMRGVVQNKDSCHGRFLSGGQRQSRANVLARAPSQRWTEAAAPPAQPPCGAALPNSRDGIESGRSLPYRSEGFKDRGFGRPLPGRPAVFWRASSMGLPSDPSRFAFKQAHRFW